MPRDQDDREAPVDGAMDPADEFGLVVGLAQVELRSPGLPALSAIRGRRGYRCRTRRARGCRGARGSVR